jgi:hypothetical protein
VKSFSITDIVSISPFRDSPKSAHFNKNSIARPGPARKRQDGTSVKKEPLTAFSFKWYNEGAEKHAETTL